MKLLRTLTVLAVTAALGLCAASAGAATPSPRLRLGDASLPTSFSSADNAACLAGLIASSSTTPPCDAYQVTVTNVGAAATQSGADLVLKADLPSDLTVRRIDLHWTATDRLQPLSPNELLGFGENLQEVLPNLSPPLPVPCSVSRVECRFELPSLEGMALEPDDMLEMVVYVTVEEGSSAASLQSSASLSGGGLPPQTMTALTPLGQSLPFGGSASTLVAGADGQEDTQAGDHPYEFRVRIDPNTRMQIGPDAMVRATSSEDVRDVAVDLPIGFLGSAEATPRCTFAHHSSHVGGGIGGCPADTIIGQILTEPHDNSNGKATIEGPIYNLAPERGVPAEFGFTDLIGGAHVLYASVVPSADGYVLRTTAPELPQIPLTDIITTFYGNPAEKNGAGVPSAFFTNPSLCDGHPLTTAVHMDSWQNPGAVEADGAPDLSDPAWVTAEAQTFPSGLTGCNRLQFKPTLSVQPEALDPGAADGPAGINLRLSLPQPEVPGGLATPPLRDAVVALPQGLTVDPSSADGLQACSEQQIGFEGFNGETPLFSAAAPTCPEASKIGAVELTTPLLEGTLTGAIYLAAQKANPFGSLLAGYIVVDDEERGVLIKIPGELRTDPQSGQITGVFKNNPQFPFEELKLHFKGGPRGVLTMPETCGTFTTTSELTPWSAPDSGPAATPTDSFGVSSGAGGSACASSEAQLPNKPAFEAGTTNPIAGAFSPFVLKLSREDGSQRFSQVDTTLPAGLLGRLAGIPYCADAQIAQAASRSNPGEGSLEQSSPSCPAASQIGTVTVGAGSGNPFYVSGKAYLSGPYKGAPLSLAIITPALAGPFDLGTVVVRAALYVNEATAQVHAVSDPIPTILDGIPLDVRQIALQLDRQSFTLNPTNCAAKEVLGTETSTTGNAARLTNAFRVGACNALAFKPTLKLFFSGKTKRTGNPAVKAVLTQPKGENANIARTSVVLPKGMLIAQAHVSNPCTRVQFNSGPVPGEACPPKSVLGHAKVWTPLLEKPEVGPVYFRSNGGERELPDLVVALRGQIPVQLVGFIDSVGKKGAEVRRVRTRFQSVPDAPISRFELKLSGGKKGLLENSQNLCKGRKLSKLQLTGQNGKTYDTEPAVGVSCPKPKPKNSKRRSSGKG